GRVLERIAVEAVILELRSLRTALHLCLGGGAALLPVLRRYWLLADLALTVLIGMLDDDLYHRGLGAIDHLDLREWLRLHGAEGKTADSVLLRALYDCCFAYRDGEVDRPDFAAGAALGCALRIGLMWRGNVFYLMNAGMGDMVVAPLFQLLRRRGVRFEFFQRVKKLQLDADRRRIAGVRFGRQARVKPECQPYDPLQTAPELAYPFWPNRPRLEQLEGGEALRGADFESHWAAPPDVEEWTLSLAPEDRVVLGISLGALGPICEELGQASADWRRLLEELPSMQTQAAQLWFGPDQAGLGWSTPDYPGEHRPVMVAAPELMDVWADMSHGLEQERWGPRPPRCLMYYCGPLPGDYLHQRADTDREVPVQALARVRAETLRWLGACTESLWPAAVLPDGKLDWNLLHDPGNATGAARLDAQYLRANIDPSERYVLSPKGANRLRLPPDRSGFDNLLLAGDWTRTAINAGCVEATVMSGMAAARALCGYPQLIHGERFLQGTAEEPAPVKVAVLGSGCGALSAAYWLSRTEELRRRYQVTIYTPGWRLGGKCASGRDAAEHQRILEHGLHIMMGFYETVFQALRDCYAAMDKPPDAAYVDWSEAFEAQYRITLWRRPAAGQPLAPWTLDFPLRPGLPGDGPPLGDALHGPAELAHLLLNWLLRRDPAPEAPRISLVQRIWRGLAQHRPGAAAPQDALLDRLHQHAERPPRNFLQSHWDELCEDLHGFHQRLAQSGGLIGQGLFDGGLHHDLVLLNLAVSALRGLIVDVLPHGVDGFARIDGEEFRSWLRRHGAWQETADDPLLMCLYDLAFAYDKGDSSSPDHGSAAAGAMLRLILRMALTYKGAPLWKMRAG
ncbi:MAG TPA: NAD(P)-binding protein, partial [Nevskia sp.]|nr:NAD(P)-binding protein [Nevskia sp.]